MLLGIASANKASVATSEYFVAFMIHPQRRVEEKRVPGGRPTQPTKPVESSAKHMPDVRLETIEVSSSHAQKCANDCTVSESNVSQNHMLSNIP